MMGVVGLTLRALVLAQHRLGTSSKLHLSLCEATLEAPIAFFDVTPIGKNLVFTVLYMCNKMRVRESGMRRQDSIMIVEVEVVVVAI